MFTILNDIAILNINSAKYHCGISGFSKNEAANLLQKPDLNKKQWNIINYKIGKKI